MAGSVANLTPKQRLAWQRLSDADGATVTFDELLQAVDLPLDEYGVVSLKTHISRLRTKLPSDAEIESVRKVGYRLKNGRRCLECGKPW